MGYFLGFALLIAGYTLVDWGHYRVAHRDASMWWLVSGKGQPPTDNTVATPTPPSKGPLGLPGDSPKPFGAPKDYPIAPNII